MQFFMSAHIDSICIVTFTVSGISFPPLNSSLGHVPYFVNGISTDMMQEEAYKMPPFLIHLLSPWEEHAPAIAWPQEKDERQVELIKTQPCQSRSVTL